MRISLNTSKWYDNIWAAMIFFTRLPLWRIHQPPHVSYRSVVEHWPLAGWITGAVMAATLYFGSMFLPYPVAIIMAVSSRILLTGALHEDGLCDFFDGFGGGGGNKARILEIMKDSRIGTYGVLGIVLYIALLAAALYSMPPKIAAFTILAADPYAKMIAGQIIMMMPYARTEEESKAKTVYRKMNVTASLSLAAQGLLPLAAYTYIMYVHIDWQLLVFTPCIVMYFLYLMIWNKLKGYTGDCCGALFLLVELSISITVAGMI